MKRRKAIERKRERKKKKKQRRRENNKVIYGFVRGEVTQEKWNLNYNGCLLLHTQPFWKHSARKVLRYKWMGICIDYTNVCARDTTNRSRRQIHNGSCCSLACPVCTWMRVPNGTQSSTAAEHKWKIFCIQHTRGTHTFTWATLHTQGIRGVFCCVYFHPFRLLCAIADVVCFSPEHEKIIIIIIMTMKRTHIYRVRQCVLVSKAYLFARGSSGNQSLRVLRLLCLCEWI